MGAWGHESFANDHACDWVLALRDEADLSLVEETIDELLADEDEFVDAGLGAEVIAACETLARLKGRWGHRSGASEPVDQWVEQHPQSVPSRLLKRAIKAIDRILGDNSELRELWQEGAGLGRLAQELEHQPLTARTQFAVDVGGQKLEFFLGKHVG